MMSTDTRRCWKCGKQSPPEAAYCAVCGAELTGKRDDGISPPPPPSPTTATPATAAEPSAPPAAEPRAPTLVWEHAFPLLTNGFFLLDMVKVWVITLLVVSLLFLAILAGMGDLEHWLPIMAMMSLVVGGLFVLSALISLIFFGNRMDARFTVSANGALIEMTSRRALWANRLAAVAGALGGSPGTTGAGLLAMSGESVTIAWEAVHRVGEYPASRTITLSNSWRTVLRLYCQAENYEIVRATVRAYTRNGPPPKPARSVADRRSIRRNVLLSALTLVGWFLLCATPFDPPVPLLLALLPVTFFAIWWSCAVRFWGGLTLLGAVTYGVLTMMAGLQVHALISPEVLGDVPAQPWMRPNGFALLEGTEWLRLWLTVVGWAWYLWLGAMRILSSSRKPVGPRN